MYRRNGVISRSFNSPHGVTINGPKGSATGATKRGVKRKFSWHGGRVRNAVSEGVLTHRPVILKEGYLNKPSFFRFGGRKRRWCVLRTYTQSEASLDLYLDETKSRYKGSISLDRETNPILIIKNLDKKRKTSKCCYLALKVNKTSYQFATDSFRELKEWCSLIRQAMDNGSTFSGKLTEPNNIEDGMVNVKFNSNCISLLCPLKEMPLKTWRLDHITSFGQSGGILTFECCSTCSDPSASRCAINMVQEKPTIILNIMERAIRSNPNTSEIHYERSVLGDIYHCGHDCTQPRLIHGVSDPSLFRSTSASPMKGMFVPIDVHRDIFGHIPPSSTLDSNDSGLPGTPQTEEALSEASSPTGSNKSNPSFKPKDRGSPYRSPKHAYNSHQGVYKARSMSDSRPSPHAGDALISLARRQSDEPPHSHHFNSEPRKMSDSQVVANQHHPRLQYAMISHEPPKLIKREELDPSSVSYAIVQTSLEKQRQNGSPVHVRDRYSRLQPLDENYDEEQIYDEPCDLIDNPFSPVPTRRESGSKLRPASSRVPKVSIQSTGSDYAPGSDVQDRTEDLQELPPPIPPHQRVLKSRKNGVCVEKPSRRRLQSSSDVLEAPTTRQCNSFQGMRSRGSMDNLDQLGRNRSNSIAVAGSGFGDRQLKGSLDMLARLHEEEEKMTKILNASKRKPNDDIMEAQERQDRLGELNRPYKFNLSDLDFDEPDQDMIFETMSNLADYQSHHVYSSPSHVDKVLTKVASTTVRGYSYKINIPVANTQYDVPRRAANTPVPDLAHVRSDAPPKPVRYTSSENLHFLN